MQTAAEMRHMDDSVVSWMLQKTVLMMLLVLLLPLVTPELQGLSTEYYIVASPVYFNCTSLFSGLTRDVLIDMDSLSVHPSVSLSNDYAAIVVSKLLSNFYTVLYM